MQPLPGTRPFQKRNHVQYAKETRRAQSNTQSLLSIYGTHTCGIRKPKGWRRGDPIPDLKTMKTKLCIDARKLNALTIPQAWVSNPFMQSLCYMSKNRYSPR